MPEPIRVPRGVETGGQFAASARGEAEGVSLTALDGSFLYPPKFHTAAEVIEFWSRVEVPDAVLARADRTYADAYQGMLHEWPDVAWDIVGEDAWTRSNPRPADENERQAWEARRDEAQAACVAQMREAINTAPERLNRRDLRPIVRACAMVESALLDLSDSEVRIVEAHPIRLTAGETTVLDAVSRTAMIGLRSGFSDPDLYTRSLVADTDQADHEVDETPVGETITREDLRRIVTEVVTNVVTEATDQQTRLLDGAFDELTSDLGVATTAIIDTQDARYGKRK